MTKETVDILTNREVLAVSQGYRLTQDRTSETWYTLAHAARLGWDN